jgi:fucose permease
MTPILHNEKSKPITLLFIAFLGFIAIGIPGSLLNVAWIHIQDAFGLTLDSIGLALAGFTAGRLVTTFINGRMLARLGAGRFLLIGCLLTALGLLGYALSPAWSLLLVAAFVFGLGSGVIDAGLNTFVAAYYNAGQLNWLHACFGIGLTLGPIIMNAIVLDLGMSWRWGYGVAVILPLITGACFLATLNQWELSSKSGGEDRRDSQIRETLRLPIVWLCLAMFFVYGGIEVGGGQLTNSLFIEGRRIDPRTSGTWISLYWASFTVGRMLIGIVINRVQPRKVVRMGMLAAIVGSAMIWINVSDTFSFIGLALLGFALAPQFPTLIAETSGLVGTAHTANVIGFQIGAAGVGATILTGLAGVLAQNLTLEVIGPYLFMISASLFLLNEARLRVTKAKE